MQSNPLLSTAAAVAKDRLEQYLSEKLKDTWDECAWEFYTFLLEKAKKHPLDTSGYASPDYLTDHKQSIENYKNRYYNNPEEKKL